LVEYGKCSLIVGGLMNAVVANEVEQYTDFFEAWNFLLYHPIFGKVSLEGFRECLYIEVGKVNRETLCIEEDKSKNTETRVWLECGPWLKPEQLDEVTREYCPDGEPTHDTNLDCGAPTFPEAIIKLANLVLKHYGNGQNGQ
jgi:hypothetical protein